MELMLMFLQKIYQTTLIQKLGFNHTWPKDLRHENHTIGSIKIPHLYLGQFLQQIETLPRMMKNENTSTLINNVINTYHLQQGSKNDPLQYPKLCTYTDSAWIQEFVNSLVKFNVKIHRTHHLNFTPNRINDINLMDIFSTSHL